MVVLADDAPPALLDQVVPDIVGRLSTDVRLVLTTRRTSLDAFVAGPARALLDEALVTMPADGTPAGEQVRPVLRARAILDPVGWSSLLPLALLRTAVDWERLDVPAPLTPQLLAEVAPVHLAALGVPAPEPEELRRVARDLVRADHGGMRLLRATRRDGRVHLAADRLFSHLADRDAGGLGRARGAGPRPVGPPRPGGARPHRARRAGPGRRPGRAVAGDAGGARRPRARGALPARRHARRRSAAHTPEPGRWDRGAINWLTAALDRAEGDLVGRAHRMILAIESRRDGVVDVPAARTPADEPTDDRQAAAPRVRLIQMREVARA